MAICKKVIFIDKNNFMRKIFTFVFLSFFTVAAAQSPWPSVNWNSADNLTSVMSVDGIAELSGLHRNLVTNRLYCVQNDGRLRVLQLDSSAMGFSQIASKALSGGPEGITQADLSANEFYVVDENNYEIRKYTCTADFGSVTLSRHWDLLAAPSPMEYTGNTGPEGIVFVPDSALMAAGFVSQQTGNLYTSAKGMGGLMFIAHQDGGHVWVFDINPTVNDDFYYVGKYETGRTESCDLSFDRTTGILYILHNLDSNYLETTNLSSVLTTGNSRKFVTTGEYFIANPEENANIEGFALMPKCPESATQGAFLCRDASSGADDAILQDVLRWFSPFAADGQCAPLSAVEFGEEKFKVYPNPGDTLLTLDLAPEQLSEIVITNILGQTVLSRVIFTDTTLDVSGFTSGLYVISVKQQSAGFAAVKWLKR